MDRHRGPRSKIGALEHRVYLALVERMAVLVQRAEQRLDAAILIAGGHARVATAHPGGEGMSGYVHPPAPGVAPESAQRACHGSLLRALRHLQRATRRAQLSFGHQGGQCLGQLSEDATQVVGPQPEVIVAKQTVIRTLTLARNALAARTRQLDVTLQSRRKGVEIVPLTP